MVFTPGDIVYSSSRLIEASPPKLGVEKLLALMESEGIRLRRSPPRSAARCAGVRVHVVGDTIVDSYSYCSLLGATAKSPTFSVKHERPTSSRAARRWWPSTSRPPAATCPSRPCSATTSVKDFVLNDLRGGGHRRARLRRPHAPHHPQGALHRRRLQDAPGGPRGQPRDLRPRAARPGRIASRRAGADVVIFSDFRHGIFNRQNIRRLQERSPSEALKVADSQVSNRWGNILDFTDFDLHHPQRARGPLRPGRPGLGGAAAGARSCSGAPGAST